MKTLLSLILFCLAAQAFCEFHTDVAEFAKTFEFHDYNIVTSTHPFIGVDESKLTRLGSGGEGIVFAISGEPGYCYKAWHPKKVSKTLKFAAAALVFVKTMIAQHAWLDRFVASPSVLAAGPDWVIRECYTPATTLDKLIGFENLIPQYTALIAELNAHFAKASTERDRAFFDALIQRLTRKSPNVMWIPHDGRFAWIDIF